MRVVVLVIDGLGIGEMPDVEETRPEDKGAHTLLHVVQSVKDLYLPNLERLGLGNLVDIPQIKKAGEKALASWGTCNLKHFGADTYMGHQELMGSLPLPPKKELMISVGDQIRQALEQAGHSVSILAPQTTCLLVDEVAMVADNMETEPGLNINVTANTDEIPFEELTRIGEIVREVVNVSRVIVVGGRGYSVEDMRRHLKRHPDGAVGVDTPGLGVYDEWYIVRHLGKGFRVEVQAPSLVIRSGKPVSLVGKAADVVECPGSRRLPMVDTKTVFDLIHEELSQMADGLVVANVQETDLAGHEQDPERWANLLRLVDREVWRLIDGFDYDDVLIFTGDHGNDPTIGHSQHTRERTPFLFYGKGYQPVPLGLRSTLADVGATVASLFSAGSTENGTSILREFVPGAK